MSCITCCLLTKTSSGGQKREIAIGSIKILIQVLTSPLCRIILVFFNYYSLQETCSLNNQYARPFDILDTTVAVVFND